MLNDLPTELYNRVVAVAQHNDRWVHCELLEGRVLTLGSERFACMEPLFRPSLIGVPPPNEPEHQSPMSNYYMHHDSSSLKTLMQLVGESVAECDEEWKAAFLASGSVFVCGGTSLLPGFVTRLQHEVSQSLGAGVKVVTPSTAEEQRFAAWRGGCLLTSSPNFLQEASVSKEFYDENGPTPIASLL